MAAVNRIGHELPLTPTPLPPGARGQPDGGLEFWGASFVSDPSGNVLRRASHDQEEVLVVECDPARMESVRRNWPFLRDCRIDAYGDLTRRLIDEP